MSTRDSTMMTQISCFKKTFLGFGKKRSTPEVSQSSKLESLPLVRGCLGIWNVVS